VCHFMAAAARKSPTRGIVVTRRYGRVDRQNDQRFSLQMCLYVNESNQTASRFELRSSSSRNRQSLANPCNSSCDRRISWRADQSSAERIISSCLSNADTQVCCADDEISSSKRESIPQRRVNITQSRLSKEIKREKRK